MIRYQRGGRSLSLWIGPLYWYISGPFPGLYWFRFDFEIKDTR